MDKSQEPHKNPESSNVTNNNITPTIPTYLDERAKLDQEVQSGIRKANLEVSSFLPKFISYSIPLILLVTGLMMWKFQHNGGELPVSMFSVIVMMSVGGFYSSIHFLRFMKFLLGSLKHFFFKNAEHDDETIEWLGQDNELPTPQSIQNQIKFMLKLRGAPTFEDYKDSGKHMEQHGEYVRIVTTYSDIKRYYLSTIMNFILLMAIPSLFMNVFVTDYTSNIYLGALGVLFIIASVMYYKTGKEYANFFYENAHIASYSLIEYGIYRCLWQERAGRL